MRDRLARAAATTVVLAGTALAATCAPATARAHRTVNVTVSGSLTFVWTGEAARGCAAAGQCGVSGSLQIDSDGGTNSGFPAPAPDLSDPNTVVRATSAAANGSAAPSTCTDLLGIDTTISLSRRRATLAPPPFEPISAGRCAGPTSGDLARLSLPIARLGAGRFSLAGSVTFGAGPFSVTAISSLRVLRSSATPPFGFSGSASSGVGVGSPLRSRPALQESAQYTYRIASVAGALSTKFSGLAAPLCQALGACAAAGTVTDSPHGRGQVHFFAYRIVKRRASRAQALADVRGGRLQVSSTLNGTSLSDTISEAVDLPGRACSDTVAGQLALADNGFRHGVDVVSLGDNSATTGVALDALRTRCPGPSEQGALRDRPLARGSLAASSLGARRIAIVLRGGRAFTGTAYAGREAGSLVLTLALVHAGGGTQKIRLPVGPLPGLPR
ncbi:MAG: hypothetical protein ACRDMX_06530 [Solirubrobacteraceae bacterium]